MEHIERVLASEAQIQQRVKELADQINQVCMRTLHDA
jgi:hypothetical protein